MPQSVHYKDAEERQLENVASIERAILRTQREVVRSQDTSNLLMVIATALMSVATVCSAWASWRMARVAEDLFRASERPYFGVSSLKLDLSNRERPATWVEFRDFGSVPADRVVVDVSTFIDGKPVPGGLGKSHVVMSLGLIAPNSPFNFAALFPQRFSSAIASGASKAIVSAVATYKDAAGQFYCFHMAYMYFAPMKKFDPAGGGTDCVPHMPVYDESTRLDHEMVTGNN